MKEKPASGTALAEAAKAYMEAHCTERFSLSEMAGCLYVNGSHLLRTFKRCTGMTPLSYHHALRCERARHLLETTDLSISKIGEAAGFVSPSHFSHIFREVEGCTPTQFRAAYLRSIDE